MSKVLFAAMVLLGVGSSAISLCAGECDILGFAASLLEWGIYAVTELFLIHILALLFRTQAEFLEDIGVMARLMAFQSAVEGYPDSRLEKSFQRNCGPIPGRTANHSVE